MNNLAFIGDGIFIYWSPIILVCAAVSAICFYGASQIVLDSTRYDHLVLRSNGFISMVQVAGLIALLIPIILFTRRYVKNSPRPKSAFAYWAGILALFGAGGYMEYYVQNNQHKALFAYCAMSVSLLAMILLLLVMRHNSKSAADAGNTNI